MKTLATGLLAVMPLAASAAPCESLRPAIDTLLFDYSSKNLDAVISRIDRNEIMVLGSDLSEIARTPAEVEFMLRADFALWGASRFGSPQFMDCRVEPLLASAAFDVPFTMQRNDGSTMDVTVRFLTVWTREAKGPWRLSQSMNSTPTVGASATDLLKAMKP